MPSFRYKNVCIVYDIGHLSLSFQQQWGQIAFFLHLLLFMAWGHSDKCIRTQQDFLVSLVCDPILEYSSLSMILRKEKGKPLSEENDEELGGRFFGQEEENPKVNFAENVKYST